MINQFNEDKVFNPIWIKIESGEIKSSNNLRIILDELSRQFNISSLKLLITFREWLLNKNIELSTINGVVAFTIITNESQKSTSSHEFIKIIHEEMLAKKTYIIDYLENNLPPKKSELDKLKELIESGTLVSSIDVDRERLMTLGLIFIKETCEKYGMSYAAYKKNRLGTNDEMEDAERIEELFDLANQSILDYWIAEIKRINTT